MIVKEKGIGLLYTIILIAVLIIAVGVLGPYLFVRETYRQKDVETLERIKAIRTAILGNPDIISKGLRSNFGYVGDMGGLPPILEYLVLQQNPTPNPFPVNWDQRTDTGQIWTVHSTGIGYGWRGPYIDPTYTGNYEFQAFRDAWGTKFRYIDNAGQTIINPATVSFPVFIRSAGPDRIFGTSDDINENTHPDLCRINEDDVRAILRGYTYCEDGTPIRRDNIYVYWPSLALGGTVTITAGGPYSSLTTGRCPYDPTRSDCRYFETPSRIPVGIRKTIIDPTNPIANQFVVINGGGTLSYDPNPPNDGRMRWNFRGGICGNCIRYVDGSRQTYRAMDCWGTRSIVEIQVRNICSFDVTITSIRLDYSPTTYFYTTSFLSTDSTYPRDGRGWSYECSQSGYGRSGITYPLNFIGQFNSQGVWRWWRVQNCVSTSITIPANSSAYLSFGYFIDNFGNCVDVRTIPFRITLSDGSVLDIPRQ